MRRTSLLLGALLLAGAAFGAPTPEGTEPVRAGKEAKAPRVLVVGSTAGRELQFFVSLLVRDLQGKRVDPTVYVQPPPGSKEPGYGGGGLPVGKVLKKFPDDLGCFDVLVAFDVDWEKLSAAQVAAVRKWIEGGGGLVMVAAPFHTPRLAGAGPKLKAIRELLPVVVADGKVDNRDATQPARLTFPPGKGRAAYLKLDPAGKEPLAGWEEFFRDGKKGAAKKGEAPENGFYSCYPVLSVRPGATVLATLDDPKTRMADGKDRPYLATLRVGKGRVAYLGSGEMWRVRRYREAFYERFWRGLLADVAKR